MFGGCGVLVWCCGGGLGVIGGSITSVPKGGFGILFYTVFGVFFCVCVVVLLRVLLRCVS
jgi:hypothetical protein